MAFPELGTALVGRDDDLAALRRAAERAWGGEPGTVLVSGEAGIGKSRLLRELQTEAIGRADVHIGRCLDLGPARTPYGPLTPLLRSLVAVLGVDASLAAVGVGADALRMLLPELAEKPVDRASTSPEGLRDAIAALVEAAADRAPQLLMIEDVHWADASTLLILSFLLRTIESGRILFLLTCRTDDVHRGDPVSAFVADLARARRVERLTLQRLDAEATRSLAEQIRGTEVDDEQLDRLQARAEGVPFFVEELAACVAESLPDGLRDVLLARFDALDDDAKAVVRVASASADGALSHTLLSHLTGLNDAVLDLAVRAGIDGGILAVRGDGYGFRHALLREAIHDDLLPGERARMHRAYAEALEAGVGDSRPDPATLAFHWQSAQNHPRALSAAVAAMLHAKANYAFASAARFGELALELWDRVPDAGTVAGMERPVLLHLLGSILRNAGEADRALAVVELALAELDEAVDPRLHVRLVRDHAQYLANLGRQGALEEYQAAHALLDDHRISDGHLRATVLNGIASRHMLAGRPAASTIAATAAEHAAASADDETERSIALNLRACSLMLLGEAESARHAFEQAAALARRGRARVQYRLNYSDSLTLRGRYREALRIAEQGLEHVRELGVQRSSGGVLTQNMVEPLLALGEIDRAEQLLATVPDGRTVLRSGLYLSTSRIRALAWRGRIAEAERVRREWLPALQRSAPVERQVWYYLIEADFALATARGDWEGAADVVRRMVADEGPALSNQRRLLLEGAWAVAEARADGAPEGVAVDDAAAAIRSAWEAQPEALRDADWSLVIDALLAPERERLEAAITASSSDDMSAVMRVALRLASVRLLVADGDRPAAATVLAEAERLASRMGHDRLQHRVAELGSVTGLRVDDAGEESELTARERQVLDLIAEGLSNRRIGERLYISAKTVSVHVSAILRKLGVSTRTEAALAATRRSPAR